MAKYFAVVSDDFIQVDEITGQLEIYETKAQAGANCPNSCEVVKLKVKRSADRYSGPVSNTKPDYWEDDDYAPYEDDSFERTYFDS